MAAARLTLGLALAASPLFGQASQQQVVANPVRKVVSMLQSMQKKVEAEGEKEEELYKKFMCYCKTGIGDLETSVAAASAKEPALAADIKGAEEELVQVKASLADAQKERGDAKAAIADATSIRENEAKAFAAEKADLDANIAAVTKAVAALEKGMAGTFLQTGDAQTLRKLVLSKDMLDEDKQGLLSFLSGKQESEYAPSSTEVTGILKQLGDEMAKSLADATSKEEASAKGFTELVAAKAKEIEALTAAIESKTSKAGELGMSIVQMKADLTSTEEALMEDKALLAELQKGCATKGDEYDARVKTRTQELAALAETVKILNDDDALELFKKALPAPSASLVQVGSSSASERAHAMEALRKAQERAAGSADRGRLDLLALALKGKKIGFEKVISMIDEMVSTLKGEQTDDDNKKDYCAQQFDSSEDSKKALDRKVADTNTVIADAEEGIAKVTDEIAALEAGIKELDKQVASATEQRKEESDDYKALKASDTAAKELLVFAKNRLNKFYNPKLYKPPAKEELSAQGAISRDLGGAAVLAEVSEHVQRKSNIAPPPATWDAYAKKGEETTGVIGMIDLLIKELDTDMTEAATEEKDAQADYEVTMEDAKKKRMLDSSALTEKGATKADLEADLLASKDSKVAATKELMALGKYIANLHAECDWLVQYYSARKEARADEIDALGKAKAVLSGADFSLLETGAAGFH